MFMYIFAKMFKYVDLLVRVMFAKHMCVCLFVVFVTLENFSLMGTSPLLVKDCKFFTYARHSGPLTSEDSLACNTYFDTGHPFMMVSSEDP